MDIKFSGFGQIPPQNQPSPGMPGMQPGMPGNSPFPFSPEQIKRNARRMVIVFFTIIILFMGGIYALLFQTSWFAGILDTFDTKAIKGEVLDLTYVLDASGDGKVWIVTNPSFTYIETVETPGSYSSGVKCADCKLRVYIYDPKTAEVQSERDVPLRGVPLDVDLYYHQDAVWLSVGETSSLDPMIFKYDSNTGEEVSNTESFSQQFPEMTTSIIELMKRENPSRYDLKLADGQEFIYAIDENKLYAGLLEFNNATQGETQMTALILSGGDTDERKKFFSITGPQDKLVTGNCDSYVEDPDTLQFFCKATAKQLNEKIFLDAMVFYSDEQMAVILHQDSLGRDGKRYLSAYGAEGKEIWSIPQEQLFPRVAYAPQDPLSEIFFLNNDITVERSGDLITFSIKGAGAIGINAQKGTEMWRIGS